MRFANHEIVPETFDVDDWFSETELFKVNHDYVAGLAHGERERARATRRAERAKLAERMGAQFDFTPCAATPLSESWNRRRNTPKYAE